MPTFCWMHWIERLAPSKENSGGTSPLEIQDLTHAQPDVDAIHAAEERGLPKDNIVVAQDSQSPAAPANRG
jgi:hypothetical protein